MSNKELRSYNMKNNIIALKNVKRVVTSSVDNISTII